MPCEKHTKEPCSGVGLKWYYFTFGCGQEHSNGYVKILAFCSNAARVIMFKMHGSKWSMQYDSED